MVIFLVNTYLMFTSVDFRGKSHAYLYRLGLLCAVLILPGCLASKKSVPLAITPPAFQETALETIHQVPETSHFFVEPSDTSLLSDAIADDNLQEHPAALDADKTSNKQKCHVKDRFDRDAMVAYEWNRSRLSLDVDGLNVSGGGNMGMYLQYKVVLQPGKNKKQACRYGSQWQGLVGSSYNEFVRRKDDTVWDEIKAFRGEASVFLENLF